MVYYLNKKKVEDDIKNETRGNFSKCLCSLLQPIEEFESQCLMEAIGKNSNVMIQIICSKEAHEIEVLNAAFNRSIDRLLLSKRYANSFLFKK